MLFLNMLFLSMSFLKELYAIRIVFFSLFIVPFPAGQNKIY